MSQVLFKIPNIASMAIRHSGSLQNLSTIAKTAAINVQYKRGAECMITGGNDVLVTLYQQPVTKY